MDATRAHDFKKVLRTIAVVLAIYAVVNHVIRLSARSAAGAGGMGGYALSATLSTLDGFRRRCGENVQGVQHLCPDSIEEQCASTVDALRILFGLQR